MGLTGTAAMPQELFDALMAEMLIQVDNQFTFLQLAVPQAPSIIPPGAKTLNFDREVLPTGTYTESSRRMTEGTDVTASSQAISETQKTLTIREYGGPHDGTGVMPFGITTQMLKMAAHDLAARLGAYLRRDRNKHINQRRMDDLLTSTNIVTPDGSTSGTIATGQKMTFDMIKSLGKSMSDALVPMFPNGRWKLIIGTKDELDLKTDADVKAAFNYWAAQNPLIATGQIGSLDKFDIFVDTLIPTTGVGAGSLVTGYQGVAFGPYHLGEGQLQPAEPRMDDVTDFGRRLRMMWVSLEAVGVLYTDLIFKTLTT